MDGAEIRKVMLEVVKEYSERGPGFFQTRAVLREISNRLELKNIEEEQAVLTMWNDLFRQGLIAWGHDLGNAEPPFLHLTRIGHKALKNLSRDPYNPDGYLSLIHPLLDEDSIALSYIEEAVQTFLAGCLKATAVMTGAAAESLVLELRDELVQKMTSLNHQIPARLNDWRIKTVRDEIEIILKSKKDNLDWKLYERFSSYWVPLTDQMRFARNEAGHPVSLDPVTHETVHASLLLFPELTKLVNELKGWISNSYT